MKRHGPAWYAHQLLSQTVDSLAVGPGDVRSRLLNAYQIFHPLTPEHLPEHLRDDFKWVMNQLTSRDPRTNSVGDVFKSNVQVSLEHMKNSTGAKIAERLLRLHYAIESYVKSDDL